MSETIKILDKTLDADALDLLLYTMPPVCLRVVTAAVKDCFNRACAGNLDSQLAIAFCLRFAMESHDTETFLKLMLIAATGRLPYLKG